MKLASRLQYAGLIWIVIAAFGCGSKAKRNASLGSESASSEISDATYYFLAMENPAAEKTVGLYHARTGKRIGTVSKKFAAQLKMQGSGKLVSGQVVSYSRVPSAGISAVPVAAEWGLSASGEPMVPFRTVSVDPRVFPLGSVLMIRETAGMSLPDGTTHDGIWKAADTGGAVRNRDIDFFVGRKEWGAVLNSHGVLGKRPLTIEVLSRD